MVDAVTGRLETPGTGGGMVASVAEALKAQEGTEDDLSWREVLAGRTFALGVGDGDIDIGDFDSLDGGAGHGMVFWGSGERRALSLEKEALSWSESEIAYTDRSGDAAIAGVHESRLTAMHPYLGWSGADGSRLWGVLGYGEGEIEDAEVVKRFGVQKGDSEFAAGASVPVVSADGLVLALKGDRGRRRAIRWRTTGRRSRRCLWTRGACGWRRKRVGPGRCPAGGRSRRR